MSPHRIPPGPQPDPMGPDPDPAPDPDPIPVPNPDPDPQPLPEEPSHGDYAHVDATHEHPARVRFRVTTRPSRFGLRIAAAIVSVGGALVACYNEVPGPQGPLPLPAREVPPQGPAPGPILPTPHLAPTLDAGLPVPQGASSAVRLTIPAGARVARRTEADPPPPTTPQPPPSDAGVVDSAGDLPPEVPDAGPEVAIDAGQPM
jgi:hypothetical protein